MNKTYAVYLLILMVLLVVCYAVYRSFSKLEQRGFGTKTIAPVTTIIVPENEPYFADETGMPLEKRTPPSYRIPDVLEAGKKHLIQGKFVVEDGGSAPQLLNIRFCSLRSASDRNESVVIESENPLPEFDGEFGSETASFKAELNFPGLKHRRLLSEHFVLVLTNVVARILLVANDF